MTATKARSLMKAFLDENAIPYDKLKAKTVDFSDLARASAIFVKIFGWIPDEANYNAVRKFARDNGFIAQPM